MIYRKEMRGKKRAIYWLDGQIVFFSFSINKEIQDFNVRIMSHHDIVSRVGVQIINIWLLRGLLAFQQFLQYRMCEKFWNLATYMNTTLHMFPYQGNDMKSPSQCRQRTISLQSPLGKIQVSGCENGVHTIQILMDVPPAVRYCTVQPPTF